MYKVHVRLRYQQGYFWEYSEIEYSGNAFITLLGAEHELAKAKSQGYDAFIVKEV